MRILLIGGSKSGKSTAAQRLCRHLAAGAPLYYWATMTPRDSEDPQRVLRHVADREGWGFRTIERSTGLTAALPDIDKRGAVLLDSVTAALPPSRSTFTALTPGTAASAFSTWA